MQAIEAVEAALESAQNELSQAEIGLIEATARAEAARESASRLEAALSALRGESAQNGSKYAPRRDDEDVISYVERTGGAQTIDRNVADCTQAEELAYEEFEAQRKRRQRQKEKEEQANNPLAHVKCAGCGTVGSLVDSIITAPSGATVRMMICKTCNNQIIT